MKALIDLYKSLSLSEEIKALLTHPILTNQLFTVIFTAYTAQLLAQRLLDGFSTSLCQMNAIKQLYNVYY